MCKHDYLVFLLIIFQLLRGQAELKFTKIKSTVPSRSKYWAFIMYDTEWIYHDVNHKLVVKHKDVSNANFGLAPGLPKAWYLIFYSHNFASVCLKEGLQNCVFFKLYKPWSASGTRAGQNPHRFQSSATGCGLKPKPHHLGPQQTLRIRSPVQCHLWVTSLVFQWPHGDWGLEWCAISGTWSGSEYPPSELRPWMGAPVTNAAWRLSASPPRKELPALFSEWGSVHA